MSEVQAPSHADLSWGTGARRLEIFLEPTCPHSGRAFGKLMPLLTAAGEDRLTVRIWLNSQPWHTFSSVVCRAVLAASGIGDGRQTALRVMEAVFAHREDYVLADHARGPNMALGPADIRRQIADHSGIDLRAPFERREVTDLLKLHARYARQNGIHVTPTFMVDGLINDKMSSGDEVETWLSALGLTGG